MTTGSCLISADEGPMLETLDYTIRIGSTVVHRPFYISICIYLFVSSFVCLFFVLFYFLFIRFLLFTV